MIVVTMLFLGALVLRAQQPGSPPAQPPQQPITPESRDETEAVRATGAAFRAAFEARDAKKIATLWSPEAVYRELTEGDEMVGRAAIEARFTEAFAERDNAKLTVDTDSLEFVSPNVAIQRGMTHITRDNAPQEDSRYTAVLVKHDGQWLFDRVTEEDIHPPRPSNFENLKELEWMIGSWIDDNDPDVNIHTDCEWTKNRNFMTRSFAVVIGSQINVSGIQVIGWDESKKQIRSWVFDSDGGFGEGAWSHKDNRWLVRNTGTLPDGGKTSSVHVFTKVDDNSFKWQAIHRDVDGELLPNLDEVLVVRKGD
jgi:uncharacterized protein (TIGR02246 family)